MRMVLVVAAVLVDDQNRILLAQRPAGKSMAGLWEFPGGKVQDNETPEQALARELKEELGVDTESSDFVPFRFASHGYDDFHLLMPVFLCRDWQGEIFPREGQQIKWVSVDDLHLFDMPPADFPLIQDLKNHLQ